MGKVKNHHFYVCSHTHWDREWYGTFEDFRMRLVELTDELLDYLEDEPEYRCFNFDGQTIVIRDYLDIRPGRLEDVRKMVSVGRLMLGPWYVLPDEFLVSGESFVHNLRLGHRIAGELGRVAKVGYLPDCFGQISQIPQILLGFGIDTYIFWRGFSPEDDRPEVIVEGPDGSRVIGYHLHDGYANLAFFPHQAPPDVRKALSDASDGSDASDKKGALRWTVRAKFLTMKHLAEQLIARDRSKVHLMMNGFDHMRIHKDLPEVLRRAAEEIEGWTFHHATFEEFFEALKGERGEWPVVHTPMRDTTRDPDSWGFILDGVLSSRMYLKQANCRCQTLLERWVGPFETLKWLEGGRYESSFLDRAWELLLQNHPHDSICGCSVDGVHRDMENRFAHCEQIGRQLLRRAQASIAARIDTSFAQANEDVLVVFNPLARPTSQLVEARLELDASGIRLGDLGGTGILPVNDHGQDAHATPPIGFSPMATAGEVARSIRGARLFDHTGEEIPFALESLRVETTNEAHTPDALGLVTHNRLVANVRFWANDLPPLGYRAYRYHFVNRPTRWAGSLVAAPDQIENEFLAVSVAENGSVTVWNKKAQGSPVMAVHFEDGADCGDSYNFAKPLGDYLVTTVGQAAEVALTEDSPAGASFEIRHCPEVPAEFDFTHCARSERTLPLEITTRVTLGAKSPYARFRMRIRNAARDHRLRVVFRPLPPPIREALSACAEGPFDVVEWPIAPPHPDPAHWVENQPATIPQHSFVDLSDGKWGLAVFNKGLPECEVVREPEPKIYLTLFRSFGHLSRNDCPSRARSAGPEMPTLEGQCLREMEFEYALYPHTGRWDEADVLALAHEFVAGLSTLCVRPHAGDLPATKEFLRLEGDPNIALSTIERSQDGKAVIVRLWNGTAQSREARLVFDRPVRSAHRVRLDETVEEALKVVRQHEVPLKIGAKKVVTVRAAFGERPE
jgi:alpha-mannosidase